MVIGTLKNQEGKVYFPTGFALDVMKFHAAQAPLAMVRCFNEGGKSTSILLGDVEEWSEDPFTVIMEVQFGQTPQTETAGEGV